MALSLGVQKGQRLAIGDEIVVVDDIVWGKMVSVKVKASGKRYGITELESTEVLPDVWMSYGKAPHGYNNQAARLAIEAPRSIKISRL